MENNSFNGWATPEEAFKELDEKLDTVEYDFMARTLSAYRVALMNRGFTRREAMKLVETYSKFVYDMVIEEVITSSSRPNASNDQDDQDELE